MIEVSFSGSGEALLAAATEHKISVVYLFKINQLLGDKGKQNQGDLIMHLLSRAK